MGLVEEMNFISWLLNRAKQHLVVGAPEWVQEYRNTIIESKILSVMLTFVGGIVWMCAVTLILIGIYGAQSEISTLPQLWFYVMIGVPVAFYFYNWGMALYEIYKDEQQSTWEKLKQ